MHFSGEGKKIDGSPLKTVIALYFRCRYHVWRCCYVYSDPTKSVKLIIKLPDLGALTKRLLYSPDGQFLMTSTISGRVQLWNANTDLSQSSTDLKDQTMSGELRNAATDLYKVSTDLEGHSTPIKDAAFSPDSRFLATAAVEMAVHVWDMTAGGRVYAAWYGPVNCLGFVANDLLVVGEATGNKRYLKITQ